MLPARHWLAPLPQRCRSALKKQQAPLRQLYWLALQERQACQQPRLRMMPR
jgi:hypothetical protein